jgi:hypothetical protein
MCEDAQLCEFWIWDGDLAHALALVRGMEDKFLVEHGTLRREDETLPGVKELLEGDPVYRLRTAQALEMRPDPREKLFEWRLVDPFTGEVGQPAFAPSDRGSP